MSGQAGSLARQGEPPAFFIPDGDRFVATDSTRGPWSRDHQHGGPPAALLARAMERIAGDGALLARLTFDFLRPVPVATLAVRAEVLRAGAKVRRLQAALTAVDGTLLVQATAVALRTAPVLKDAVGESGCAPPPPDGAAPFRLPFFTDAAGYHTAVEVRVARGTWGRGPVAAWMRVRAPLVEGEAPSRVQRLVVAADSASGLAVVLDHARHTWLNPDLTIALHREPAGDWLCIDAATVAEPHGVGLTRGRLWDVAGAVGTSLQSLMIEARPVSG